MVHALLVLLVLDKATGYGAVEGLIRAHRCSLSAACASVPGRQLAKIMQSWLCIRLVSMEEYTMHATAYGLRKDLTDPSGLALCS